jgi:hypothetical protein
MVDRALRRDLLQKLGVSPPALSKRAKVIKGKYGPMSTDEAVYVIAHLEGLDLSKYLPLTLVDRVRFLVPHSVALAPSRRTVEKVARGQRRQRSYPLVSQSLIQISNHMGSEVYPQMFALENSIRELIRRRLAKTGSDWWNLAPRPVRDNVDRTMRKEARYTYRSPRGTHPIDYSNFDDLKSIILANPSHFSDVITDTAWFRVKMEETYMARNNLAHCVPLPRGDDSRIALFARDWEQMLRRIGEV